jgi:hypothetical protein
MSRSLFAAAICLVVSASGCAIHPLPEDVTGVSTYHIVRRIRCEARQAVIDTLVGWLIHDPKVSEKSRELGFQLANGERDIREPFLFPVWVEQRKELQKSWQKLSNEKKKLPKELWKKEKQLLSLEEEINKLSAALSRIGRLTGRDGAIFEVFRNTGVAYHFELEMEVQNDLSTQVDLLKPFSNSKYSLNLTGGVTRHRQNNRTFTITDTFSKLIVEVKPDYCDGYIVEANYVYPIVGKVGIEPVVQEFVRLTLFGNLTSDETVDKNPSGPPTMVDALQFETKISGSGTPKVEFSPVGNAFRVADASLTGSALRRDLHKLTIGLALDKAGASLVGSVRSYYFGSLLTASGGRSELAAATAVSQYLNLTLFRRTVIVPQ